MAFKTLTSNHIRFRKNIKLLAFFSFIFSMASLKGSDLQDKEAFYQEGINLRNQGDYKTAAIHFEPLALEKNVRAQHNLAMCFYKLNDETQAYEWFKEASDQGFKPSQNNIKKLNLVDVLLSDELIDHMATFLPLKDLGALSAVSHRTHRIVTSLITLTNFLTSSSPYALDFMIRFQNVTFDPQPEAIRMQKCIKVDEGPIEVHFRDPQHLKSIVEETPLIKPKSRLLFVKDENTQDGQEIVAAAPLITTYFINILANVPLKLAGNLYLKNDLHLPESSDFRELNIKKEKGSFNIGPIESYDQAYQLEDALATFDRHLFVEGTVNIYKLFAKTMNEKVETSFFPKLSDFCPDYKIVSSSNIAEKLIQYVDSKDPFIYIAKDEQGLKDVRALLPDFRRSISLIDKNVNFNGIYCKGELYLRGGFKIYSDTDVTLMGLLPIRDYNLLFKTKKSLWLFAMKIKANSLRIYARNNLSILQIFYSRSANIKPDSLDESHWNQVLDYYVSNGIINRL